MKKQKKIFLIFTIMFAVFIMLVSNNKSNASSSDLYLNSLDFDAVIDSSGNMNVTETWNIRIEDTNTLFKTFKTDTSKYSGISNVKVTQVTSGGTEKNLKQINELMYHVTKDCYYGMKNNDGDFEIAWGVGLDSEKATRTYKISYTVKDVVKKCEDCSELYWQFVGKDFKIDAKKITGKVTLPGKAQDKNDIRVWGHTEGLNGEIYATSKDTVEFEINQFKYGRFVEVRVAIPQDISIYSGRSDKTTLQDIINEETIWAEEANAKRERKQFGTQILYIFITLVVSGLDILFIVRIVKNKQKCDEIPEKFKPSQEIKYYRDLPDEKATPGEALRMLKFKLNDLMSNEVGNIFAATILDLSLKGLVEFQTEQGSFGRQNIRIIIKDNDIASIQDNKDELEIFNFVKDAANSKGGTITSKELEKYIKNHESKVLSLKKKLDSTTEKEIYEKGYVDKTQKSVKDNYVVYELGYFILLVLAFIGMISIPTILSADVKISAIYNICLVSTILILCIVSIINIIIKNKTANKINVFTQQGVDKNNEWKGLKKFMEEFSMLDKREVPEVVIWEKYLVYATAFGIADKVIKQLKIVYPNFEEMENINTGIYMGLMMNTNFSSSFSHSVSSAMSSAYSSGSGGGGGFSGGGGRRPEEAGGGGGR